MCCAPLLSGLISALGVKWSWSYLARSQRVQDEFSALLELRSNCQLLVHFITVIYTSADAQYKEASLYSGCGTP
eukprot:4299078-Amphidinium_carterae.1